MDDLQIRMYDFSREPLKQSNYARRISNSDWDAMRSVIVAMFERRLPRKYILEHLRVQHEFHPSMSQLVSQVMRWGLTRDKMKGTTSCHVQSPWDKIDPDLYFAHLCKQPQVPWENMDFLDPSLAPVEKQPSDVQEKLHDWVFSPVGKGRAWEVAYFHKLAEGDPAAWIAMCRRTACISRALVGQSAKDSSLIARDFIVRMLQIGLRSNLTELQYDIALVYGMMYLAADACNRQAHEEARRHAEAACTIFQGTPYYETSGTGRVFNMVVATLRTLEPPAMDELFQMGFEAFIADPVSKIPGLA